MKSAFWANVVRLLHVMFVVWVLWVPFSNNEPMLVLYMFVIPFLWMHWLLNQDTCALTLLERYLRGVDSSESFMHNVVSPVYVIRDDQLRAVCWVASAVLWLIALRKVLKRPAMIREVFVPRARAGGRAAAG
jgi:hypothetical protein